MRDEHLYGIDRPMLFLQGTRDPFATANELEGVIARIGATAMLQWRADANHSFEIRGAKRTPAEVGAALAPAVARFLQNFL